MVCHFDDGGLDLKRSLKYKGFDEDKCHSVVKEPGINLRAVLIAEMLKEYKQQDIVLFSFSVTFF